MKVQLIVVQGKPEGKVIPINGPIFKIGRGEGCHLRPNSELISREHVEIALNGETVTVRDLGSRNGTLVNNKPLTSPRPILNGDLIQVGPLTFAVSIMGVAKPAAKPIPAKGASLDGVSNDEIDSWLIGDQNRPAPEDSGQLYKGDTMTFSAFKTTPKPEVKPAESTPPEMPDDREEVNEDVPIADQLEEETNEVEEEYLEEEFIDENNPFYVAKKQAEQPSQKTAPQRDSSEAAQDILRRLMERRRASR
jgi:predicted component of type VI protein secretion system